MPDYQAILVVSFGGPEGREDVLPFLENVLRGRNVPRERMLEVAEHYYHFGGVSPINEQNRKLIAALEAELEKNGPHLPIYWGNRNWHPMLADTLRQMRSDGIERALAFVTSAFSSYSGCRQYREDIARAQEELGEGAPSIDKLRVFYNHPGFVQANVERIAAAVDAIPGEQRSSAKLVFTAHSIPNAMAAGCNYEQQLHESARLIAEKLAADNVGQFDHALVYQSRSGPPQQPWLEPDICDYLRELDTDSCTHAIVVPLGFVSDHMEVLFDLDTEAQAVCDEIGLQLVRVRTVGTHPTFISMIRDLIVERKEDLPGKSCGSFGPNHHVCPEDCCLSGRPAAAGRP